ncbi:helix-turn-helix domain-containing protein [Streptomyces sp. NRRL F-5135]|uniref:helix-turn-helix domain-containing protein n=1 Tax=Streptomyces sp. NRRL F-5135 TaxID=1463858 RepID=UPI0004CB6FA7|nr:helix-turn-helix domain-containing protein [Streptomyces sp. NRRL F-5135]
MRGPAVLAANVTAPGLVTVRPCRTPGCGRSSVKWRTVCWTCKSRAYRRARATPDPVAVDRAVHDRYAPAGMTRPERRAAALQLTDLGLSAAEIGRIVHVTPRTVSRWRTAAKTRSST